MKQLKIYIILSLYLISSIGILVDFHYCGGELVEVSLYQADEDGCCGEDEEKEDDCCEDKYVLIETDNSENYQSCPIPSNDFVQFVASSYREVNLIDYKNVVSSKNFITLDHAPPNGEMDPLYLKNGILRI